MNPHRNIKRFIYAVILLFFAGMFVFFYYEGRTIEVKTVKVKRGRIERSITGVSSGTVEPLRRVRLQALLPLRIREVNFREGERIEKGDVIIKLDDSEIKIKLDLQKAALTSAELRLREIEERYRLILQNYERAKKLFKEGMISDSGFDETRIQFNAAEKELAIARNALKEARLGVSLTGEELEKTNIRAPFDGLISFLDATAGEIPPYAGMDVTTVTSATMTTSETKPFCEVIDDSILKVEVPFDEVDAKKIKLGQASRITSDLAPDRVFDGRVSYVSSVISKTLEQNRTVDVEIDISEEDKEWLPVGASVDVEIILDVEEDVLTVPTNTVIERDGRRFVYAVEDGRITKRYIKTGISNWEFAGVLEGLKEGDNVVTTLDVEGLEEGRRVRGSEE